MPRKLKPGEMAGSYEIVTLLNTGAMAFSYEARSSSGERVFLKQYKSPTITVEWYRNYVTYQRELKNRIESSPAQAFCYRIIDFYEAEAGPQTYFQVFEFVEDSEDMAAKLEQVRARPGSITFEQRLTLAKVMMAGIAALHDVKIVHCDLKPPNIQLFRDTSILAGYQLKLIDMDYSILADRRAPWHGYQGYVGTPMYLSPEHCEGGIPCPASDVFTCGIILYELLAQGHPFADAQDAEEYQRAILGDDRLKPILQGTVPPPATNEAICDVLSRCLHRDSGKRPTAREVNQVLNGASSGPDVKPVASFSVAPTKGTAPLGASFTDTSKAGSKPLTSWTWSFGDGSTSSQRNPKHTYTTPGSYTVSLTVGSGAGSATETKSPCVILTAEPPPLKQCLCLHSDGGEILRTRTDLTLQQYLCRKFGDDAQYVDKAHQCKLHLEKDGSWVVIPNPDTPNETLLNGKAITGRAILKAGDMLGVGRESKKIVKLPLRIDFE